ncbi:4452_t:CDS:2, partial [Gigaspora rosea]
MTETKLAELDTTKIRLLNPYYKIYTSNYTYTQANISLSSMGTAIAKNKPPLFKHMGNCNLTSTLSYFDIAEPTWSRGTSHSQLDDIWISSHMIIEISPLAISLPTDSTDSDHMILTISWHHNINTALPRTKKNKHKVFLYDKMNEKTWTNFSNSISQTLIEDNLDVESPIIDSITLNKQWHKLNLAIKRATNTHIPFTMRQQNTYYAFSRKATDLHQGPKKLNKILKQATKLLVNTWNTSIVAINKMTKSHIPSIATEDLTPDNHKSLITRLKSETKTLWHARNIENNTGEVVTEPAEIKHEIAQHYEHWTRRNTPNELLREEWTYAFNPKNEIQEHWYNNITQTITTEE